MQNLLVTAAIIQDELKLLLAQRLSGGAYGGKWEFPGGKVEPGESPEEALEREIMEELELAVEVGDIAAVVTHKQPNYEQEGRTVILLYYFCKRKAGNPKPIGCQDFRWVEVHELLNFELAPADHAMALKLLNKDNRTK